jgi:type I restriction enzyme S subunit
VGDVATVPIRFHKKSNLRSRALQLNDIVFEVSGGSKGQPVGRALIINQRLLSRFPDPVMCASFCKLIRIDPLRCNPRYAFRRLQLAYVNGELDAFQVQSTGITNFRWKPFLEQFLISLPGPRVQQRLVGVLDALDDLIENNRRRIELLEQMAQAIYREWFVRFRYPGHEDATFVDSPLGPIPEGWDVQPLRDVATVVRGRSYRKHELVETGGIPFVNLKCMMRGGGFRRDGLKRYNGKHNSDQRVEAGDIVLAVTDLTQGREILARATLVPRLDEDFGVISLDVIRLIPKQPEDRLAILFALRCTDFSDRVKEFANGSTVLHLSPTHVADGEVVWPCEALRRSFSHIADPMLREVDDLKDAAVRLAGIRDLLLPKLVTGEIDVSHLDLDAVVGSVA